jgi:hypothetical protein
MDGTIVYLLMSLNEAEYSQHGGDALPNGDANQSVDSMVIVWR